MPRPASVVPVLRWTPAGDTRHAASGLPLQELWDEVERYVWNRPGVAGKTAANRRRTRELSRALPDHPTPRNVVDWMVSLDAIFAPGTVENHRKGLMALYRFGAELGLCSGNPAACVPSRRPDPKPHAIVNIKELWPQFMAACRDDRERAFLGVLWMALLRRGEALGVFVEDVNTTTTPWRLNVVRQRPNPNKLGHTKPKSLHSCKELPIREPLRRLLAPVLAEGRQVVRVGRGGGGRLEVPYLFPYRERDLDDLMARLRAVAPLAFPPGHKAWHALRDTGAVELRLAGKTRAEVSEMCGHSSEAITSQHYLSVHGRSVSAAIIAGLDPPRRRRRAGVGGAEAARTAPAPRRSTKATTTKQGTPCTATTKTQRSLPGLSVGPLITKPRRRPPA